MALNALFVGASGLTANSTALDVVGNNLANINTTGYKAQRTLFRDMMYQTTSAGSAATQNIGGTNPVQFGFGVGIGSIDSLLGQGSLNPTGRNLDAGIQGTGFFVTTDGNQTFYTRAGGFGVDSSGFLIDPGTGNRVQRTGTVGEPTATAPGFQVPGSQDIRVPIGAGLAGLPTTAVGYQGNLSSSLQVGESATTSIQVFDSQSTPRALTVTFTKTAANTFDIATSVSGGTATPASTTVAFDTAGLLTGGAAGTPVTIAVNLTGIPGAAAQTVNLNLGVVGQTTGLTQFGGTSTATAVTQDGSGFGTLTDVSFDALGNVQGRFSNGRTVAVAQLAIAGFNNPGGLIRLGQNNFTASASSGEALIGTAGQGGLGTVQGGSLEGANVDIAIEFSRLIIAQRGFQVNARTITAANETLQELANIVR
jgi:flagellar hook protein FlgE